MKKNIVIALLAIISLGLVGYIVYDKVNDDKIVDNDTNNDITESTYLLEDFTNIISNELGFLVSQHKLSDLTNKEKTYMLYLLTDRLNGEIPTIEKLENIRKNSSLREMEVEYTDIYDSYTGYELVDDVKFTLNNETGEYVNNNLGHGGIAIGKNAFLYDYKIENNKYILTYKYAFIKNQGDGPTNIELYYAYEDAINKKNMVKEFELKEVEWDYQLLYSQVNLYISENYNNFKDKLDTYTYVFEIHDGNIVLTDFYRN